MRPRYTSERAATTPIGNTPMKYTTIYHFLALDEIKRGKTVRVLDRRLLTVCTLNELSVNACVAVLNSAAEDTDRYEFWYEETEENENA